MYSQKLLEHFHHPCNVGEISQPSAATEITNPACGDVMKLWITVREGRIADIKFKVQGCIPAVACASWMTEAVRGRALSELAFVTAQTIETELGGLPEASHHASALAVAALRQALETLQA